MFCQRSQKLKEIAKMINGLKESNIDLVPAKVNYVGLMIMTAKMQVSN